MDYLWTPWRMTYIESLQEPTQECIFCSKLAKDDEAEYILRRGKRCYAALNLYPYTNGHVLIVPHNHVTTLEELSPDCLLETMTLCQQTLSVLRLGYQPRGFNVGFNLGAAAGAGLPEHIHMHVVPRWFGDSTFMSVVGTTRILPELLGESWKRLRTLWDQEFPLPGPECSR
jgi:ATP adenylyltransferase